MISQFQIYYQETAEQHRGSKSIFTASTLHKHTETEKKRDCLCRLNYKFQDCYYLIPSKRPSEWIENREIREKIDKKLENETLQRTWERVQKEKEKKSEHHELNSFYTASYTESDTW